MASVISRMIRAGGVCAVAAALTLGAAAQAADGKAGGPFKVVYVMNDQLGDHGFNDSANRGFEKLKAEGRVLRAGHTNSVGAADIYILAAGREVLCGTVLATTRNFKLAK